MARLLLIVCVQLVLALAARALDDCGEDSRACSYYTETVCHGNQKAWARLNCPNLCGDCGQDKGSENDDSHGSKKMMRHSSEDSDDDSGSSEDDDSHGSKKMMRLSSADADDDSESFCSFGGNAYRQGETWEDGCKQNCTCINSVTNAMLCKDRCPTWNLGPGCVSQQVSNECCERVFCGGNSFQPIPTVLPRFSFY